MNSRQVKTIVLTILILLLTACAGQTPQSESGAPGQSTMRASDEVHYQSALEQLNQGNAEEAAQTLATLASRYENNPDLQLNLATAYYLADDLDRAEAALAMGGALDGLPHPHNLRGLIAVQQGDYKSAELHYRRALERNAQHARSHYNLALLYDVFHQDIAAARPHYQRYLELIENEDDETTAWLRQIESALARGEGR